MRIYKRGKTHWLAYTLPKELAAELGIPHVIRESTGTGNLKEAQALARTRTRQIMDGSWLPSTRAGSGLTVARYAEGWTARRRALGVRAARRDLEMLAPFMVVLGEMRIDEVRREHVVKAVDMMLRAKGRRGKAKGKAYAPNTVHRHYQVLRALFGDAVRANKTLINPCTLSARYKELPKRDDAEAGWRQQAVFKAKEVVALISDTRVPEDRRAFYALAFFTGMRLGEVVGRRWGDIDHDQEPLAKLRVLTQYDGRPLKTETPREVPVHPELAAILAEWRVRSEVFFGRKAEDDDLIMRNRFGRMIRANAALQHLQADLARLGLRRRRFHDLRRSMISIARADGARGELLVWVTHGARQSAMIDLYTTPSWESLCEQVSCIKVARRRVPPGGNVVELRTRSR